MQRKGINKLSKFSLHAAVDWAKSCRNTIFIWMGSTILLGRKWGFTLLRESFNEIRMLINSGVGGFFLNSRYIFLQHLPNTSV